MIRAALIAAAIKDVQLLLRDRGALASLFALPVVFIVVFGLMFEGGEGGVALSGFQISVPGNAVLFGFFLALTMALSFVEERDSGTWRRLLAAPLPRRVLLVAKLAPYFVVGLVQMTLLFGVGALGFGMQVAGSLVALALLTMAVVFCAVALGLFIASFGGSSKQIGAIGSISLLVMGLLGGAMVPRLIMPDSMKSIGLATPHAWALDGYYDILLQEGTGVAGVLPAIGAVAGFGVLFATLGAARFRFER